MTKDNNFYGDKVVTRFANPSEMGTSEDFYGIQWTLNSRNVMITGPSRIGNETLHKTLPIQSKMKRCMVSDNGEVKYISSSDYKYFEDGTNVNYQDTTKQCMVEIPEYYYYVAKRQNHDGSINCQIRLYPEYKAGAKKSRKVYVSAWEATSDGSKLMSVMGYGDGKPISNLTRAQFRQKAAARGAGWTQQYWNQYMAVVRLYVVEYCNFNTQADFISSLDHGFKQGGLRQGVSNYSNWASIGYAPFVDCGITYSLSNETGVISYTYDNTDIHVPSYRGIENPFGHIWKWMDGINIYGDSVNNKSLIYVCDDITKFADDTTDNYVLKSSSAVYGTEGYIKTWNWDQDGDFIPLTQGGSSDTYLCDYSWFQNAGWKVLYSGGRAADGSACGWFCFDASVGSGYAGAKFGGRLCYTPSN